jgi:hypothetical protein
MMILAFSAGGRERQKVLARVKVEVVNVRTNGLVACIAMAPCPLLYLYAALLFVLLLTLSLSPTAFISLTITLNILHVIHTLFIYSSRTKCETTSKVRSEEDLG